MPNTYRIMIDDKSIPPQATLVLEETGAAVASTQITSDSQSAELKAWGEQEAQKYESAVASKEAEVATAAAEAQAASIRAEALKAALEAEVIIVSAG